MKKLYGRIRILQINVDNNHDHNTDYRPSSIIGLMTKLVIVYSSYIYD